MDIDENDVLTLNRLPYEIVQSIFTYLEGYTIVRLSSVCLLFKAIASNDVIIKQAIENELTKKPKLLIGECYYDFYKRSFIGNYRCILCKDWFKKSKSINCFTDVILADRQEIAIRNFSGDRMYFDRFAVDNYYCYKKYCFVNNYSTLSDGFKLFLFNAAQNNLEVWTKSLCCQMDQVLSQTEGEDSYFQTLSIASQYNSCETVAVLLHEYFKSHKFEKCRLLKEVAVKDSSWVNRIICCISFDKELSKLFIQHLQLSPLHQALVECNLKMVQQFFHLAIDFTEYRQLPMGIIDYTLLCSNAECVDYVLANIHSIDNGTLQATELPSHDFSVINCKYTMRTIQIIRLAVDRMRKQILQVLRTHSAESTDLKQYYIIAYWHAIYRALIDPTEHEDFLELIRLETIEYGTFKEDLISASNDAYRSGRDGIFLEILLMMCCNLIHDKDCQERDMVIDAITKLIENRHTPCSYYDFWKPVFLQLPQLRQLCDSMFQISLRYDLYRDLSTFVNFVRDNVNKVNYNKTISLYDDMNIFRRSLYDLPTCLPLHYQLRNLYYYEDIVAWVAKSPRYKFQELTLLVARSVCNEDERTSWLLYYIHRLIDDIQLTTITDNNLQEKITQVARCYFDLFCSYGFIVNKCTKTKNQRFRKENFWDRIIPVKSDGMAALHHACYKGDLKWIEILLMAGADRCVRDCSGKFPIDYCDYGYLENPRPSRELMMTYVSCPRAT